MAKDVAINSTRLIRAIWMNPGISRIALAGELGLNKSTITKITAALIDEGIVDLASSPDVTESKGRRPTGLYISNGIGVIIGIEVQTDRWNCVAITLHGEILDAYPPREIAPDKDFTTIISEAIRQAADDQKIKGRNVIGAGIGLPGLINPYQGIIISSNPLKIDRPLILPQQLEGEFPFPILIENDANCCCWNVILEKRLERERNFLSLLGEFRRTRFGPSDGYSEVRGIGVGIGVVIKDSVLHGTDFSAGEFQSILKRTHNPTQFNLPEDRIGDIATDRNLWKKIVSELSQNISLLVNVLNITLIKVFGDFVLDRDLLIETMTQEIEFNWPYDKPTRCDIEISSSGEEAVALGAAGHFLHRIFSRPDIWEGEEAEYPTGIELLRLARSSNW